MLNKDIKIICEIASAHCGSKDKLFKLIDAANEAKITPRTAIRSGAGMASASKRIQRKLIRNLAEFRDTPERSVEWRKFDMNLVRTNIGNKK